LARPYLIDHYTNRAKEMICQACYREMPFRLPNGLPYFEAPQLLAEASSELVENHLAFARPVARNGIPRAAHLTPK
jgi:hypothetical protein